MNYYGDIKLGKTISWIFTATDADGVATDITDPIVSVYENGSATQYYTGATIVKFDSLTGFYKVTVDTSDNIYDPGKDYTVMLVSGAIGSVSIVNYVVGSFSIENRTGSYYLPAYPVGEATNISDMIVQLWTRFFKKVTKDKAAEIPVIRIEDGTIVLTEQPYSESSTEDYVDEISA